jgi:hypothetical protein
MRNLMTRALGNAVPSRLGVLPFPASRAVALITWIHLDQNLRRITMVTRSPANDLMAPERPAPS